jgi:hypothetical protein
MENRNNKTIEDIKAICIDKINKINYNNIPSTMGVYRYILQQLKDYPIMEFALCFNCEWYRPKYEKCCHQNPICWRFLYSCEHYNEIKKQ